MREDLKNIDKALNMANKAGAFTLYEALAIVQSFERIIKFIGERTDISEPVQDVPVEEVKGKLKRKPSK